MKTMKIGPRNKREKRIFAIERFRVDVQHAIFKAMEESGMTDAQLAKKLGITQKKVKSMFGGSWNPTLTRLAKIAYELGYNINIRLVNNIIEEENEF